MIISRKSIPQEFIRGVLRLEKYELSEREQKNLLFELNKKLAPQKTPLINYIIGIPILFLTAFTPLIFGAIFKQFHIIPVIWAVAVVGFIIYFFVTHKNEKINNIKKAEAMKNNRYSAYIFDVTGKHGEYILSGDLAFEVDKHEYCEDMKNIIVVLIHAEKKTELEFIVPEKEKNHEIL